MVTFLKNNFDEMKEWTKVVWPPAVTRGSTVQHWLGRVYLDFVGGYQYRVNHKWNASVVMETWTCQNSLS